MSLSPMELVVKVYDVAIQGCKQQDMNKVCRALVELISALRFEYEDVSVGLFRLYQYCMDCVKREEFAQAEQILTELRETWIAVQKQQPAPKPQAMRVV